MAGRVRVARWPHGHLHPRIERVPLARDGSALAARGGRPQGAWQPLGDLGAKGQGLVGERFPLVRRNVLVTQPAGDVLQPRRGGLEGQRVVRSGQRATSLSSAAMRPRMPLTRPGASLWQ